MKTDSLLKSAVSSFIDDEALSQGAAISFYAVTTLAPLLLIIISIAGLFFGQDTAQNAIVEQFKNLMGQQTADFFQRVLTDTSSKMSGSLSAIIGGITLVVTATGAFSQIQSALNKIWKVESKLSTISHLIRARAASLGMVLVLGFLLTISLVISAILAAFGDYLEANLSFSRFVIYALNAIISFGLVTLLFGAIYKVLPDRDLEWRDVAVGAVTTSLLFSAGKFLIAWYLATSAIATAYGAAGSLILLLLWIYYSVQIFLFGAEFTKAYANIYGSTRARPVNRKTMTTVHI